MKAIFILPNDQIYYVYVKKGDDISDSIHNCFKRVCYFSHISKHKHTRKIKLGSLKLQLDVFVDEFSQNSYRQTNKVATSILCHPVGIYNDCIFGPALVLLKNRRTGYYCSFRENVIQTLLPNKSISNSLPFQTNTQFKINIESLGFWSTGTVPLSPSIKTITSQINKDYCIPLG